MSNSFRLDILLPEFISYVNHTKKQEPTLTPIQIMNKAFEKTKNFHPKMTFNDRSFLFLRSGIVQGDMHV